MNLTIIKSFEALECYACACLFAVTSDFKKNRVGDHNTFYCPNGHPQSYIGETEAERLKKQLAQETSRRALAEDNASKFERKLKRVQNGVCPECNRSFENLQRHIKTKHSHGIKS